MGPAHIPLGPRRASVYLLRRLDCKRFKLGWARRPLQRVRHLPEYGRGELDLKASSAIWLPARARAEQIERSLHKTLAPYSAPVPHDGDGCSEWVEDVAHDTARRLLAQMPVDEHTSRPARVVPLTLLPPPADAVSIETQPQDVWWRVEDLLLRLVMHCPVTVHAPPEARVVVHGLWKGTEGVLGQLRQAALDADTFQCRHDGRWLAFVQTIDRDGEDVVLQFTPLKLIERWPLGPDLVWQVGGLLAQLKHRAPAPRPA